MAYTEKVSISGTALSFLLYECVNSGYGQEGFLIGDVTSEITNHISDSQSDSARVDTQILIHSILPLPSVSLFYLPTGKIKEDALRELLSNTASEVIGWYKFRRNNNIKPTFRDKLVAKGLQKYFEKYHNRKNFVTCSLTNKTSVSGSTHTFTYRFGKINFFDMYEYIEDVTANLGEKMTGYRKVHKRSLHGVFNKIVNESNLEGNCTSDAILRIQEAVDVRLRKEARIAAKNESIIRELEAEIKQMSAILSDKHALELQASFDKIIEEKYHTSEVEMAEACALAVKTPSDVNVDITNFLNDTNNMSSSSSSMQLGEAILNNRSPSPVIAPKKSSINYAAALKKTSNASTSNKSNSYDEDLITFDVEEKISPKKITVNEDIKSLGESSPEY